jgi:hypothetical protein
MIKLQEKMRDLKASALGGTGAEGGGKSSLPAELDKDKQIDELKDKLLQAERNKEILQKSNESEVKSSRIQRARFET